MRKFTFWKKNKRRQRKFGSWKKGNRRNEFGSNYVDPEYSQSNETMDQYKNYYDDVL